MNGVALVTLPKLSTSYALAQALLIAQTDEISPPTPVPVGGRTKLQRLIQPHQIFISI